VAATKQLNELLKLPYRRTPRENIINILHNLYWAFTTTYTPYSKMAANKLFFLKDHKKMYKIFTYKTDNTGKLKIRILDNNN